MQACKLGIEIKNGLLSENEYAELYHSAKIAVFPYIENYYRYTSSGRLLDATAAGCYALAPQGSLTANQAEREGWGSSFKSIKLADEIAIALNAWPTFRATKAPTPEASLKFLLGISEGKTISRALNIKLLKEVEIYLLFCTIFLGTGLRSFAPKFIQAIKNILTINRKLAL